MPETEKSIFEKLKTQVTDDVTDDEKFDLFKNLGKSAYVLLSALIGIICLLSFKDYIFSDKYYVFKGIGTDSLDALYPYLYNSAEFIAKHTLPTWSFNYGMGQNTLPLFLRDPFDIFLYLAGKNNILNGIVFVELIKILLTGVVFYCYLKTLQLTDFVAIIGSLFYCFCSYMIIGGVWHFFSFEVLNMALLLIAFELLLKHGKWFLFPIPIFFIALTMPLNLYFYGVFMVCYTMLRLIQSNQFTFKFTGSLFIKMLGLSIIGVLLSGPFFLENVAQLFENPRVGGNNSLTHQLLTTPIHLRTPLSQLGTFILRLFSNDLLGTPDNFKGWRNVLESPMFYCGLPCLLLMPQLFAFLEKKVKIFFLVFIIAWFLPIIFPWFRYAFWLFSGNYFRVYSFFISFFLIYYALQALNFIITQKRINLKILISTIIVLLCLLYFPYFNEKNRVNLQLQLYITLILVAYGCILYLIGKKNTEPYFKLVFLGLCLFELYYFTDTTVNAWNALTTTDLLNKKGYNDYTIDAVNYLKKRDTTFYRIDKNYFSSISGFYSLNDALLQDYHGTSSYGSFNQLYYINYLQMIGLADKTKEKESRWATGLIQQPVPESENRVKYFFVKNTISPQWFLLSDSITTIGDVKIYKNRFVLPFGYTYNHYIKESDFNKLSNHQKICASIKACVIENKVAPLVSGLTELKVNDSIFSNNSDTNSIVNQITLLENNINCLIKDTLSIIRYDNNYLNGNISVNEGKIMYLSIPYDKGWNLKIDGLKQEKLILSGGMTGVWLTKGFHTIEMKFQLRFINIGILMSVLGIVLFVIIFAYSLNFARKTT